MWRNNVLKYHAQAMDSLLLWCSPEHSPPPGFLTVYWTQYISEQERENGTLSLPEVINKDASYWKPRYMSWIDEVGKRPCGDTTVVDALVIRPGLSYWWMTIPSEFSFSPTSIAYATLRLWALAQIVDANSVQEVRVAGADAALQEALTLWCNKTGRQITIIPEKVTNEDRSQNEGIRSRIKKRLPALVNGIGYLAVQYLSYYALHRDQCSHRVSSEPAITIVDDFAHCDIAAAHNGNYEPHYWGPLTQVLEDSELTINWVHIDLRTSALSTVKAARNVVTDLNRGHKSSHHLLLQDFLSIKVVANAITVYFRIRRITRKIASDIEWLDPVSKVDVAALVARDLASDFRGAGAARNALWICLFDAVLKSLPRQTAGIYLMENQSFELALVNTWKSRPNGPIIGFVHGPVREWDLRYALGAAPNSPAEAKNLPRPTLMGVNGPLAEKAMLANGARPEHLVAVEALRFESGSAVANNSKSAAVDLSSTLQILMLGEYGTAMSQRQLTVLLELTRILPDDTVLTFRPHPGTVRPDHLPQGVRLSQGGKLVLDLDSCDVVITSNVSNAALDACLHGLPLIMQGDGQVLNGTPVPREANVYMVTSAPDIATALSNIRHSDQGSRITPESVFNLDPNLSRWRTLLGLWNVVPSECHTEQEQSDSGDND